MIARRKVAKPSDLDGENGLTDRLWYVDDELKRSASVARKPIAHSGIGVVVVDLPSRIVSRVAAPMGVDKPFGVLVVLIAFVRVLKRRLDERQEQTCH